MTARKKKGAVDLKSAAANDDSVTVVEEPVEQPPVDPTPVVPPAPATPRNAAIATGAKLHEAAGRPAKADVLSCFGKTGYSYSWQARADKLKMDAVELATLFKSDPAECKRIWEARSK